MQVVHNLIGGQWQRTSARIQDLRPADGSVLAEIPRSDAETVDQAVSAAAHAFPAWSRTAVEERASILDRIADLIEARHEHLAGLESADTGKPIGLAAKIDIPRAVANFRFFAGAVRHTRDEAHHMSDALNYTVRQPLGVVGLITPWNLPLYLLSWKVAPALAMGNTIVAKPSELTPLTADALGQIALEAGLPPGVFNVVHGLGAEAGAALVSHPDVKAISFTGGTATGRSVAKAASPQFKKLSLELGGKNPTIVFADADLDRAVAGIVRAAFTNQGQICLCGSRIFVQRDIVDVVVERAKERVEALKLGDPADPSTELGALISAAHRDKVEGFFAVAKEEGGSFVTGGKRPCLEAPLDGGFFLEPTLITGLSPSCRTASEEIFGPVATIHPFNDERDAIAQANDVEYGLSASIWTSNLERAHRVATQLECGMVWVNTWLHRDLRVPFGGSKNSGVGREGGEYSLGFFSEAKNICIHLGQGPTGAEGRAAPSLPPKREPTWAKGTSDQIASSRAPRPVGAYPHARKMGDLLFLSGVGPRDPKDNSVPGGPIHDAQGQAQEYDIKAQTHAVIDNVQMILEDAGASLDAVVDIQVFLIDMKRDFAGFNQVYRERLGPYGATRTTIAIRALPTPIAVEFKVIAKAPQ